jgi:hypothetical protein
MKPLIATIKSNIVNAGKRALQVLGFGQMAAVADEYAPWGVDSCPLPNTEALYFYTTNRNRQAIAGYRNNKQATTAGETRIYGTDTSGNVVCNIWIRNDSNILIGTSTTPSDYAHHFVRYEDLNTHLQSYITDLNTQIGIGVASGGGSYTPPTSPLDISSSKVQNILIQ